MPLRTSNTVEKNVVSVPLLPVIIPAATSVKVLDDISKISGEFCARYVFNAGGSNLYYAFGHDVDPTNFEGWIVPGQMFDASNCGQAFYVYSATGGTVSRTLLRRNDLTNVNVNIL